MIDAASDPKAVDPAILADALAHISHVASKSTTQSRRVRWIQKRAECALAGQVFEREAVSVPRDPGPDTVMRLQMRVKQTRRLAAELVTVLRRLDTFADALQAPANSQAAQLASAIKNLSGDVLEKAAAELEAPQTTEGAPQCQ